MIYFGQELSPYSIFTFTETPRHSSFFSGIICGPPWGSFVVLGSFAVQFGDHLRRWGGSYTKIRTAQGTSPPFRPGPGLGPVQPYNKNNYSFAKAYRKIGNLVNRPLSRAGHVDSQEKKRLCFCTSKLVFKFFTARLDVQNVLFQC